MTAKKSVHIDSIAEVKVGFPGVFRSMSRLATPANLC